MAALRLWRPKRDGAWGKGAGNGWRVGWRESRRDDRHRNGHWNCHRNNDVGCQQQRWRIIGQRPRPVRHRRRVRPAIHPAQRPAAVFRRRQWRHQPAKALAAIPPYDGAVPRDRARWRAEWRPGGCLHAAGEQKAGQDQSGRHVPIVDQYRETSVTGVARQRTLARPARFRSIVFHGSATGGKG